MSGMEKGFQSEAWEDYLYWVEHDKKTLKKINDLIKDIARNGNTGIGHPEPLKNAPGFWSRRIDDKNRLVYTIENDRLVVTQCRGHYTDR